MSIISVGSSRLEWIDWMKVLGIYLVVLGHFYSIGEKFIYVFHIPLFFLISGFLSKRESDKHVFWKKLWYNLAVPMLVMTVINFVYACGVQVCDGTFDGAAFYWFVRNVVFGMVAGFDTLWFVYTLMLLKMVFQYCSNQKIFYALSVMLLALAYVYNHANLSGLPFFLNQPNAIVDACTAFPFFALGVFARDYKNLLNGRHQSHRLIPLAVIGFLFVSVCWYYNGNVGLHACCYGGNMLLFLLGGLAGSIMVFAVSKLFGRTVQPITIISRGTIIILGLHKLLIYLFRAFFPASSLDVVFAAIIIILFVPVILMVEKSFPLMAGIYRIKSMK